MREFSNNSIELQGILTINELCAKAVDKQAMVLDKIGQHIKNFSQVADFTDMKKDVNEMPALHHFVGYL
jgi:hypothetical protein